MVTFETSIYVERHPQDVFEFIQNLDNNPYWRDPHSLTEIVTPEIKGVGAQLKTIDKFLGRQIESLVEITCWEPPHRLAQRTINGPVPFEHRIELYSHKQGTNLTISGQAEFSKLFSLAGPVIRSLLLKRLNQDLGRLKSTLEQ